ncbi:MerR family transcriptional regulator [Bacillus sp. PS06]|uniref:MerR family transcriptional regulator n=1 Tax=Bacillus sp. PS06 TaxID=2764176 RepID=UPI001781A0C9|nr:MerR family transcriptional regulator [Bacillus sp. PS06]MBD8067374.1 MerR family transcriptional regulator [Bacillus sp. PS06]
MEWLKVKEVANLVGISVRTLHHYDEIGLLIPQETTEAGYRLYSNKDLETLQQILFFKELGFQLKQIKEIINNPLFDSEEALQLHKKALYEKRDRLNKMISMLEKTIEYTKGEIEMTNKEKFEGFNFSHNPFEQEARERWGNQAVDQSNKKLAKLSQKEQLALTQEWDKIYQKLATLRHESPHSADAQEAIKDWYDYLNNHFGTYTFEAFKGLGLLYVDDQRFTKNIDKYGEGLAKFMSEAMGVFADNQMHS